MPRHIKKSSGKARKYITNSTDVNIDAFDKEGNNATVFLSIKNIQHNYQCFSQWTKAEMSKFWKFNERLHQMNWQQVYATSGKDQKTGLAYTVIPREKYGANEFISQLDKEIKLFELRVDGEMRVHGYRMKATFFLCFFG